MTNLKSRQNSANQIFNANVFFLFLLTGDNDITILYTYYLHILHHLQAIKMTFLKLIFIGPFKDSRLAGKWTNLAENPKNMLNSAEFMELLSKLFKIKNSDKLWTSSKVWTPHCPSPFLENQKWERTKFKLGLKPITEPGDHVLSSDISLNKSYMAWPAPPFFLYNIQSLSVFFKCCPLIIISQSPSPTLMLGAS